MALTLLLKTPAATWREWLKAHRTDRDLIVLDPADPNYGHPGRLCHYRHDRVQSWRFYGSLEPQRAPHVLVAAAATFARDAVDPLVLLYPYRAAPVLRHLSVLIAQVLRPDEILAAAGGGIDLEGWPVGPTEVELEGAFPPMVQGAQRKAQWISLEQACEEHEVDLGHVSVEGARLGSGERLDDAFVRHDLSGALHAERSGSTLFLVTAQDLPEDRVARALDHYGCTKVVSSHPDLYQGLLCSFANQKGEDFGMGQITRVDFERRVVHVRSTAVAPAPVRILRLGSLRLGANGAELPELKPWQV